MEVRKLYKWLLITFVIWPILDFLLAQLNINLAIIRYLVFTLGSYYTLKLYFVSPKYTKILPSVYIRILSFMLFWISIRYLYNLQEVLSPTSNFLTFKQTISGGLFLYFSFYLTNIVIPLRFFKYFLKTGYILSIIFLIVGIPMIGFFTENPVNQAEMFVKNFFLGNVFLMLLFPYQKSKVNLAVAIGFVIALLMMLILARRNVVLYLASALFFLSLVTIFSNSKLLKTRKILLLLGSLLSIFLVFIIIFIMQLNFDVFFERASTGMSSREAVMSEFNNDFDSTPNDWVTGRGPFGKFSSILGDINNENGRGLIENGYYQLILQKGYLFLIPFIFLSLMGIINGFFRSKNHLSKAAAILIIVNLIDMVGYGLPFLGLKYLNLLIALGFSLSPVIRNMDDFEIKKLIRL